MSVKVIGDKALERELEKRFGIKEMVKVQDNVLHWVNNHLADHEYTI